MVNIKTGTEMPDCFNIYPVGMVRKKTDSIRIEVFKEYQEALSGLEQFSHIHVFYWFHQNDDPDQRKILKVHPRGNKANPLTGVFATHSPVRPNLIAMSVCRVLSIRSNEIYIDDIDAFDKTPVVDIKGYFPFDLSDTELKLPEWE